MPAASTLEHNPLEQRWSSTPEGDILRNHLRCSVHNKNRELSNLVFRGGDWVCRSGHCCLLPSCGVCGDDSHRTRECWMTLGSEFTSAGNGLPGSCRECGTLGHTRARCPLVLKSLTSVCAAHQKARGLCAMYRTRAGVFQCRHDLPCFLEA